MASAPRHPEAADADNLRRAEPAPASLRLTARHARQTTGMGPAGQGPEPRRDMRIPGRRRQHGAVVSGPRGAGTRRGWS